MRWLTITITLLFVAGLVIAALTLVSGGKGLLFAFGAGHPVAMSTRLALIACGTFAAVGLVLWRAAYAYPRKYYPLMAWRDRAIFVAVVALIVAVALPLWHQFAYGVH